MVVILPLPSTSATSINNLHQFISPHTVVHTLFHTFIIRTSQVLSLGGPGRGGEEMVDLVYDPVLNCYYDQKTNKYYELKH